MKQQILEQELKLAHKALDMLVQKTRLLLVGSEHLDPGDMQRTFRFAEAVARKHDVEGMIEMIEASTNKLVAQYGTGVRPAWVGEEIGMNYHQAKMYREELDELKEELGI